MLNIKKFFYFQSKISRLPAYLTVSFVRFQYKVSCNMYQLHIQINNILIRNNMFILFKGKEGINAKVLKDIKFPIDFDAFELCSKSLQDKLTPMRSKFKVMSFSSKFQA